MRTPSASETSRITSAWIAAVSAERTICESTIAKRDGRRGEEPLDDLVVEVVDHRHAAPRRAEERVHDDDRRCEERDVRAGAETAELVTFLNSCP